MREAKGWLLMTATVLLLSLLASTEAALPFKKVSIAKTPASTSSTTSTTTEATAVEEEEVEEEQPVPSGDGGDSSKPDNGTLSKNSKLTGIPQIDYIWDPNLPRELRGYNLSTYPFLSTVPPMDEIHFKCEGLHDGFYASIEYKCQIYHHCVYGIRHDFLCANFTAFDQRTFICHFASDVDCEGSQKYWNRNDELYMATTTTSTSTTTTPAPPTQAPGPRRRPQRPQRPLRRPYNRRPIDDYYYEDQDQYEDDYYEERPVRRPKPRPRQRKPQVELDYDDEYDEKRAEAKKPIRRNRNRYRDDEETQEEDYDERPSKRPRGKPTAGSVGRKVSPRKPGRVEERRSFNEDRPVGRRRTEKDRTTPSSALDDLDEYEKPYGDADQEEAAEEQTPQKVKTTPKPLTEFITPKAAAASVYARPRAPPRIARPVPINEKKKFSYPVQKITATTLAPSSSAQEEDDYPVEQAEEDYEQPPARNTPRRRTPAPRAEQKPTRTILRKPVTDKKPAAEEYDEPVEQEPLRKRKRPLAPRSRVPAADVDFEDEDYEESPAPVSTAAPLRNQRLRSKTTTRKPTVPPRPRKPIVEEEEELDHPVEPEEEEAPAPKTRANLLSGRNAGSGISQRPSSIYAGGLLSRRKPRVHIDSNTLLPEEQPADRPPEEPSPGRE